MSCAVKSLFNSLTGNVTTYSLNILISNRCSHKFLLFCGPEAETHGNHCVTLWLHCVSCVGCHYHQGRDDLYHPGSYGGTSRREPCSSMLWRDVGVTSGIVVRLPATPGTDVTSPDDTKEHQQCPTCLTPPRWRLVLCFNTRPWTASVRLRSSHCQPGPLEHVRDQPRHQLQPGAITMDFKGQLRPAKADSLQNILEP